jgi:hydroxymethylbilane synthase
MARRNPTEPTLTEETKRGERRAAIAARAVRIGSRGSPLAVAQAHLFGARLAALSGGAITYDLHTYTTTGDKIQDRPLQEAGGKGLFTKELDRAQKEGEIDLAVHSLKDMPVRLPRHLAIASFLPREDPRDCLLGPTARLADLPEGAVLGTSSLRRKAQALAIRPDLRVVQFRGNVQTRLRKLDEKVADATLLAAAGLRRLGLADHAASVVEIDEMLPAGGQGIIAVTIRTDAPDWLQAACAAADDRAARLAAVAERAFLKRLDGSCRTPIAAHFRLTATGAWMAGEVLAEDGSARWRCEGALDRLPSERDAQELGLCLGEDVAAQRDAAGARA